ncbi:Ribosome maturation protein SDO1 [Candidatus Norongarragalina meridionalis]|nr:Ribosome maturation protein SDO1 [Candidatus Norongarragalina meridionalis]
MSGIENTIVARLEKGGERFEILVDPKLGYEYKTGARKDITNVLVVEEVFKDAQRGERQTGGAVKKFFGTDDINEIAKRIFAEGELQLTTDQRRKLLEEKRTKIVSLIAANVVDPRTKAPHPPQRIEKAMEEARVHIDAFKSAEAQVEEVIEEIREIIPISTEKAKVAVKVPADHAGRAYGLLKEYGMTKDEWANDGSLLCVCEFPAGMSGEFFDRLNRATAGQAQTKSLN